MTDEELKKNMNPSRNIVPMTARRDIWPKTSLRGLSKGSYKEKDLIHLILDYLPILRGMNSVILGVVLSDAIEKLRDTDMKQRFHLIRIESQEMKEILESLTTKLELLKFSTE